MFNDDVPPLDRIFTGPHMGFLVLSRALVRVVVPTVPYIVISITDPENDEAEIAPSPLQKGVLRLRFHDTQEIDNPALQYFSLSPDRRLSDAEARKILAFVRKHQPQIQLIVCHCEAGVSRSAAVAAALSRILQDEDDYFFEHYMPNTHVYKRLLKAAGL
jgi:predicted protein tyrosine phosphatase